MKKADPFSPTWEDIDAWGAPTTNFEKAALTELRDQQRLLADSPTGGPTCIVYDEEVKIREMHANMSEFRNGAMRDTVVLNETDAFARQDDKGPYHWAQGPQDLTPVSETTAPPPVTPPVDPSPSPEPTKPGTIPRKGKAITTTHLRVRRKPGTNQTSLGVLPTGTEVELTGGVRIVEGTRWVRIVVGMSTKPSQRLRGDDRWLTTPPPIVGWVNGALLAVPASEYVALDFPPVTHEYLWWLDDAGGLDTEATRKTLTAIADDPRGPLRAGIALREAASRDEAHVLVRMVDTACGGAAGCYYKRAGEKARVDVQKRWFDTSWLSRVFLHETFGHSACRSYDHYQNAPQYPRDDYHGLMGNWQDHYGDHAWPDEDDIGNMRQWKEGRSDLVFVRDLEGG